MVLPIGMFAVLSANFYEFFLLPSLVHKSLPAVMLGGPQPVPTIGADHLTEWAKQLLMGRTGGYAWWGFLGVIPAILVYYSGLGRAERLRRLPVVNVVCLWLRERMFLDALYHGVVVRGVLVVVGIAGFVDRYVIEAVVGFVVLAVRGTSTLLGKVEFWYRDR